MPLTPLLLCFTGAGAVVLALSYGLWSYGSPAAGLMPAAAGTLLVLASAGDVRIGTPSRFAPRRRLLAHILALLLLPFATIVLGMLAALAVYLFVVLGLVERLALRHAVLITALATGGCWLLFERLLSVPLPRSPVF